MRVKPNGKTDCRCGGMKKPEAFFCDACTAKLPRSILADMASSQSWPGFRALLRRAVVILGLPQTHNQQRKKLYA
jgi:hypothetical protein